MRKVLWLTLFLLLMGFALADVPETRSDLPWQAFAHVKDGDAIVPHWAQDWPECVIHFSLNSEEQFFSYELSVGDSDPVTGSICSFTNPMLPAPELYTLKIGSRIWTEDFFLFVAGSLDDELSEYDVYYCEHIGNHWTIVSIGELETDSTIEELEPTGRNTFSAYERSWEVFSPWHYKTNYMLFNCKDALYYESGYNVRGIYPVPEGIYPFDRSVVVKLKRAVDLLEWPEDGAESETLEEDTNLALIGTDTREWLYVALVDDERNDYGWLRLDPDGYHAMLVDGESLDIDDVFTGCPTGG